MTYIQQLCIFAVRIDTLGYETTHLVGNEGRYGVVCSPIRSFTIEGDNVSAITRSYNEYSFKMSDIINSTNALSDDAQHMLGKWLNKNKAKILQLYSKDNISDAILYTR